MAGWTQSHYFNQITGGISPTLSGIKHSSPREVTLFRDALLGMNEDVSNDLNDLLLATGLRFFDECFKMLSCDPIKQYVNVDSILHSLSKWS